MRIVGGIGSIVLGWALVCGSPSAPTSPLDDGPLAGHLDRQLAWDCDGPRDTLTVARDGTFTWVADDGDGGWTRVDGTWTLASSSAIGARLTVDGTRSQKAPGADRPEEAPFSGDVHLSPVRLLPGAGVARELDRWHTACVARLEPAALVDAAIGVDAVAMRGALEGVFHP